MASIFSGKVAKDCLEPGIVSPRLDDKTEVYIHDAQIGLSIAKSLKRIADLLEVTEVESGKVVTLPQILLRISQAVEPTNQSGMNSLTECLFGIMMNGRG